MLTIAPIQGVTNTTVLYYFETLNAGQFQSTSNLFADDGVMYPPFEEPIVGKRAIAIYLEAEAKGITLHPKQGSMQILQNGQIQVDVLGKVEMPLFGVNVHWLLTLNTPDLNAPDLNVQGTIASVTIKLLASPQELIHLQR